MSLATGQVLHNRYRIVKMLGKGGFGAVYKAWDIRLRTSCAVKENLDISPAALKQFSREARILANLTHPNLPRVTDYFIISDQGQYLVMDFVDGMDLDSMMLEKGGRVSEEQAINWTSQMCDALAYLHAQNPPIIHRDIKPKNVIITRDGKAMLVDFGIAKVYDPQLSTTLGAKAVTPGYSPPEQYGQGTTDKRSDVYAIGATLYTLLTGQPPIESIQRSIGTPLTKPRSLNPEISNNTEAVIQRAMQIPPTQRFNDVPEFITALLGSSAAAVQIQDAGDRTQIITPAGGTAAYTATAQIQAVQEGQIGAPADKGLPKWTYWVVGFAVVAIAAIAIYLITNPPASEGDLSATETMRAVILLTSSPVASEKPSPSLLVTLTPTSAQTAVPSPTHTTQPTSTPTVPTPTSAIATLSGDSTVRLTFDQTIYYMPALSPDQRKMVSFAKTGENWQIVEIDPDQGGTLRQVTSASADYHHPHFSADGESILLAVNLDGFFNIYLISFQTGEVIQKLTDSRSANMTPYWFPDERSFAFMSNRDGDYEIYIGYLDGSPPQQITNNAVYDGTSAVSPDGSSIVYYSNSSGNPDIYIYNLDSSSTTQLTTSGARDAEPVFSPDGEWIAFESNRGSSYDIWVIRPDGSDLQQVTSHPANQQVPVFSPDGRWLLYQSDQHGSYDIFRIPWNP